MERGRQQPGEWGGTAGAARGAAARGAQGARQSGAPRDPRRHGPPPPPRAAVRHKCLTRARLLAALLPVPPRPRPYCPNGFSHRARRLIAGGARAQVAPEAVVAQVQGAVEAVLRDMPHPVDRALYLGTVFASVAGARRPCPPRHALRVVSPPAQGLRRRRPRTPGYDECGPSVCASVREERGVLNNLVPCRTLATQSVCEGARLHPLCVHPTRGA